MADKKEKRKLECKVSKAEIEERKNRLPVVDRKIANELTAKREEMAAHNGTLRELREEQENLVSAIEKGVELRDVDCFWRQNDRLHKKELVRADTGEVVNEEPQTLADKQEGLFDGKPPKGGDESDSGIVDDDYGRAAGKKKTGRKKKSTEARA